MINRLSAGDSKDLSSSSTSSSHRSKSSFWKKFLLSFVDDENIVQYTFLEDAIPPSLIGSTQRRIALEPENSFRGDVLLADNLNSVTFDVHQRDNMKRSLLHHAVIEGNVSAVETLLNKGLSINAKDKDKRTPLHYAVMYYHQAIIRLLIEHPEIELNSTDYLRKTPLNTAFDIKAFEHREDFDQAEYIDIVIAMVDKGADLLLADISNKTALDMIAINDSVDELFFTGIFHSLEWFEYLPKMKSPLRLLNKLFKYDEKTINSLHELYPHYNKTTTTKASDEINLDETKQSCLYLIIQRLFRKQDPHILRYLVCMLVNLEAAAEKHVTEEEELLFFANKMKAMIYEIFRCESMEFPLNVQKILQPKQRISTEEPLLLTQAKSFHPDHLLSYCILRNCKILFSIPPIADYVDDLLYSSIRKECMLLERASAASSTSERGQHSRSNSSGSNNNSTTSSNNTFAEIRLLSMNLRSCPFAAFVLRFCSKLMLLGLIAKIAVDYSNEYGINFNNHEIQRRHWDWAEILLVIFTILELLYEYGQFTEDDYSFSRYLLHHRSWIELIPLVGISVWSFLRIRARDFIHARVVLSLVAIPQAISLLSYLSLFKPLGELILVLRFVLIEDITIFAAIFLVFVIGFGITIFALFHNEALFPTNGLMFLQLFQYALNAFDFSIFQTNSIVVNTIGVIVLILFLVLTAIVLMNILIARLTNTHQRVVDKAVVEWSFAKSILVSKFLLLSEVHPLKIIPPPFNLFPVACLPIHYYYAFTATGKRTAGISIVATLANLEYSMILGGMIRAYGQCQFYFYHLYLKAIHFHWKHLQDLKFWFIFFPISVLILWIRILFAFITPVFHWKDHIERIDEKGNFQFLRLPFSQSSSPPLNTSTAAVPVPTVATAATITENHHHNKPDVVHSNHTDSKDSGNATAATTTNPNSHTNTTATGLTLSSIPTTLLRQFSSTKMNQPTKEADVRPSVAPAKVSRRTSLMTKRKVRTSILAIDAFSNRKNTVFERLYTPEDMIRVLSWIHAETMNYQPSTHTKSSINPPIQASTATTSASPGPTNGPTGPLNTPRPTNNTNPFHSVLDRNNSYREEDAHLHYRQIMTKFDTLQETLEEIQERLEQLEEVMDSKKNHEEHHQSK